MKAKLLPDVAKLTNIFYIDSSIPEGLRWLVKTCNKIIKDSPAGYKKQNGYFITKFNNTSHHNHRIIYSIFHNTNLSSEQIVDHIDRDPSNNNPLNLRIATESENRRNVTKRKNTSSEFIGVHYCIRRRLYAAKICINKKYINLGRYASEIDAATAYNNYIINNNLTHFNLNKI